MTPEKTNTDWADLDARLQSIERHAESTDERLQRGDERMGRIEAKLVENTAELIENTAVTREVRDWLTAGRVVKKVGSGIGGFAGFVAKLGSAGVALYVVVYMLTHGGTKPPGH